MRTCLFLIAVGLCTGCADRDARVVSLFGGEQTLQALATPKSVAAYRIDPESYGQAAANPGKVLVGYPITSPAAQLSADQMKQLATILADPGTYSFEIAKGCEFRPGVALVAQAGKQEVIVLLCFGCSELAIYVEGTKVGHEDMDNAHAQFAKLAKQLFPNDKEIQGLK
ncbi:MAG: hypothetical protein SFU86_04350 [Pirellulaceae bacterium]|nr:hypothetical protein [Pirellulaceae bacterium]